VTISRDRIERYALPLILLVAALAGLAHFFDRVCVYHDEIINTYKAQQGIVLDYAKRPLFYLLNFLALNLLGSHPLSLTFLSFLSFLLTTFVIYKIALLQKDSLAFLVAPLMFVFLTWSLTTGISAMPHGHSGLFIALSLWAFFLAWENESLLQTRFLTFTAGFCSGLAAMVHPTAYPFAVALLSLCGIFFVYSFFSKAVLLPFSRKKARTFIYAAIAFVIVLICCDLAYRFLAKASYFSFWISVPEKLADQSTWGKYFEPFNCYFLIIFEHFKAVIYLILFYMTAVVLLYCLRLPERQTELVKRAGNKYLLVTCYTLLLSLLAISIVSWKFERVLVKFAPLMALSFAFIFSFLFSFFKQN